MASHLHRSLSCGIRHTRLSGISTGSYLLTGLFVFAAGFSQSQAVRPAEGHLKPRVVWQVEIGSCSGSPTVHRGKVLIGTNNSAQRDPSLKNDHGVMMCFDQDTGAFLGQVSHSRLLHRSNDMPGLGICCHPCVEEDRAYYVSNRGELVCLDLGRIPAARGKLAEDKVRWRLDMVGALGVFKRDAGDIGNPLSSPLIIGDLVFCVTGNGTAFGYGAAAVPPDTPYVPKPGAPSFVAVNKITGKLVWSSDAPGKDIQYGQWGSPAHAQVAGVNQVLFPGGDGWLYGFEVRTGQLVWKVDCNPASATRWESGKPGTRTAFMSAPIVRGNYAYIGVAVDLEMTHLKRPLYAIDLTHKGDATRRAIKWTFSDKQFGGTFGSVALGKDTLYAVGDSGLLVCLDPATGKELWRSDMGKMAKWFNSPVIHGDKVLVGAGDELSLFQDARQRKLLGVYNMGDEVMGAPVVANNRIYVATRNHLSCLAMPTPHQAD